MTSNLKRNGFSLVEILITVLILAGASIALTKFQAVQMQGTSDARNRNEAMHLAQTLLDEYRREFQTGNIVDKAVSTVNGKSTTFSVSGDVSDLAITTGEMIPMPSASPIPAPAPKQAVANVSWSNAQGQTQNVVLATILRYSAQSFAEPVAATPTPSPTPTPTPSPTAAPIEKWDKTKSYKKGDLVLGSDGLTYRADYDMTSGRPDPSLDNWWTRV